MTRYRRIKSGSNTGSITASDSARNEITSSVGRAPPVPGTPCQYEIFSGTR